MAKGKNLLIWGIVSLVVGIIMFFSSRILPFLIFSSDNDIATRFIVETVMCMGSVGLILVGIILTIAGGVILSKNKSRKTLSYGISGRHCTRCGNPTRYVPDYGKYYCELCRQYL